MVHTAIIAGVGPGLGESIARKFVDEGCQVGLFARSSDFLSGLTSKLGANSIGVQTDITQPKQVTAGFQTVRDRFGEIDLLVNHASGGAWKGVHTITKNEFEHAWRVSAFGAFLCTRNALSDMLAVGGGTIIFTGATSSIRGRDGALGFSAAKFAVRGMAESIARELGPEGIHVAHVVIDGQIGTASSHEHYPDRQKETFLDPDSIAETYWHLVEQDRSSWTLELDVRPHVEPF